MLEEKDEYKKASALSVINRKGFVVFGLFVIFIIYIIYKRFMTTLFGYSIKDGVFTGGSNK